MFSVQRNVCKNVSLSNKINGKFSRMFSAAAYTGRYEFETLSVSSPCDHVLQVELNRPDICNAMSKDMLRELLECFNRVQDDKHCRAVVLCGAGKVFSAGLDFEDMKDMVTQMAGQNGVPQMDVARRAKFLRAMIHMLQEPINSLERCGKPVISAVNGGCIGAAISLISAADIRYCAQDSFFQMKEVDVGMVTDMGALQRLPDIIGNESVLHELIFTARKMSANEAKEVGLVSKVFADAETTRQASIELAQQIASKSPVAVQGSKICLKQNRNQHVQEGLKFMALWNMAMLQSEDFVSGLTAVSSKSEKVPIFADL
ncbi:delta(3:5)-Delta(2:4)-dienoyl-CoA isomerase-like protein [Dinothrombium tinctorium]|uniref:Delta(3,5)-Delta(2,4)-dienoyl-CoA isomerase, mitochondrial n=1 Tax=Dinothrombium tinctorium TaxID=1965070 RepID=A0A3S3NWL9_9ACAR|nr:delta(3:5)-Delta(2:4)-dienoyl-CoA isomerase-like protein [Dinothrombium tinctorium]